MASRVVFPRLLRIGCGIRTELPGIITDSLGCSRPLIVTDPYLASLSSGRPPLVEQLTALFDQSKASPSVFSATVPDPTSAIIENGLKARHAHSADSIVAFGGGSPIDTAKAIANPSVLPLTYADPGLAAADRSPSIPLVILPTTAGTGSEATRFSVITDVLAEGQPKRAGAHDSFVPYAALVDPEYTLTAPAKLTADTGIDAMVHAVEALVSQKRCPFSSAISRAALAELDQGNTIRDVYRAAMAGDTSSASAVARRTQMARMATYAGMAFSTSSVALVHGMSRPLGAHFHVTHGAGNAMLFAQLTRWTLGMAPYDADSFPQKSEVESLYAEASLALGLGKKVLSRGEREGALTNVRLAELLVEEIEALVAELAIGTPKSFGIPWDKYEELIPLMAQQALESGSPGNNPRVPSKGEVEMLYRACYG